MTFCQDYTWTTMNWLLLLMLLWLSHPQATAGLAQRIQALVEGSPRSPEVGVAVVPIDGRDPVMILPDTSFHAASTMKVPVMIELFRQAEAGMLRLDEQLPVRNEFHSIV